MAKPRKKWQVTYGRGGAFAKRVPSQPKAYEWIRTELLNISALSSDPIAVVWVDEGDNRGWQRYDEVDLNEWAATMRTEA